LHFHTTAIDGVFTPDPDGEGVVFTELPPPTDEEVATLLKTVVRRIHRLLVRRGLIDPEEAGASSAPADPATTEAPALATLQQASLRGVQALGRRRVNVCGASVTPYTRIESIPSPAPCTRASTTSTSMLRWRWRRTTARDSSRCAATSPGRRWRRRFLELLDEDRVRVALRHPWRDGTTHLEFEPLELIGRLAAFVPRPRTNLTLYHGVLAPNARLRADVVAYGRDTEPSTEPSPSNSAEDVAARGPKGRPACGLWTWADLMRRTFAIDVLARASCGGRLELVSLIT